MTRERWIWDRTGLELVSREEYDRRQELRAQAAPRHEIKMPRRVQRGRWVYRGGKLIDIAKLERQAARGLQIIRDIEPYKAIAADVAGEAQPVIGGRRQHREFLKRNGYVEHGNDMPKRQAHEMPALAPDLQRAMATGMTPDVRAALERSNRAARGDG